MEGEHQKDPSAQALGARGGRARAARLTPEQRREAAREAARARWDKPPHTIIKGLIACAALTGKRYVLLCEHYGEKLRADFAEEASDRVQDWRRLKPDAIVGTYDASSTFTAMMDDLMATV